MTNPVGHHAPLPDSGASADRRTVMNVGADALRDWSGTPPHGEPRTAQTGAIRVLVADDDCAIRDSYRDLLGGDTRAGALSDSMLQMRARLFGTDKPKSATNFEVVICSDAEEAVRTFGAAAADGKPFEVAFLDMRMPPGPDGAWAAKRLREIDPALDVVIVTAYSDINPEDLSAEIQNGHGVFYIQKPFHAHEIRQMATALGTKRRVEERVRRLAYYCELTGLPNRTYFHERLRAALTYAQQHQRHFALMFIDLDNFKQVNDTLGHAAGDTLIREVGARLKANLREGDGFTQVLSEGQASELARMGGDEFTVLLFDLAQSEDAGMVAGRLMSVLQEPVEIAGHKLAVTASIGIAVYPEHGEDVETLLKNADLAMYFAKRAGRDRFHYFAPEMNEAALRRLTLEKCLRHALQRGEFSLHYQPQIDLMTEATCGMEALLRWHCPEIGSVPPLEFIPIAEETGLIVPIGYWVLRTACSQAATWHSADGVPTRMAVNVSARQFMQPDFTRQVAAILEETGLPAGLLELELTESQLMRDGEFSLGLLNGLKKLGVSIAVDDFGTGYSSLSYLKRFPVDRLKIDGSFLSGLHDERQDASVACSIIKLADSLGLQVTAKGVEEPDQLDFLKAHRCAEIQGFLYSRPLPLPEATDYLKKRGD